MNATSTVEAGGATVYRAGERYTANEIAQREKLHPSTIRKMFCAEVGVIRVGRVLRIPGDVVLRVFARLTIS